MNNMQPCLGGRANNTAWIALDDGARGRRVDLGKIQPSQAEANPAPAQAGAFNPNTVQGRPMCLALQSGWDFDFSVPVKSIERDPADPSAVKSITIEARLFEIDAAAGRAVPVVKDIVLDDRFAGGAGDAYIPIKHELLGAKAPMRGTAGAVQLANSWKAADPEEGVKIRVHYYSPTAGKYYSVVQHHKAEWPVPREMELTEPRDVVRSLIVGIDVPRSGAQPGKKAELDPRQLEHLGLEPEVQTAVLEFADKLNDSVDKGSWRSLARRWSDKEHKRMQRGSMGMGEAQYVAEHLDLHTVGNSIKAAKVLRDEDMDRVQDFALRGDTRWWFDDPTSGKIVLTGTAEVQDPFDWRNVEEYRVEMVVDISQLDETGKLWLINAVG